jgi:predicted GNAT superfamily acetyltransferase
MKPPPDLTSPAAIQDAAQILNDACLTRLEARADVPAANAEFAWRKLYPDLGLVYFVCVGWQHANVRVQWGEEKISMLDVMVQLQGHIWGLPVKNRTSPIDMSVIRDTGGSIIFAYLPEQGLSPEGWLGFALAYGSRTGVMASRFLGVKDGYRGIGIGSDIKFLQAHLALRANHYAMEWTFDPMRSMNAYLNLNVLGTDVHRYVESKYGEMGAALYGRVPSHRFYVRWHLTAPATQQFWQTGQLAPVDVASLPEVTQDSIDDILHTRPPQFRFGIPRDIGAFTAENPQVAMARRELLHATCIDTLDARLPRQEGPYNDPAMVYEEARTGDYSITAYRLSKTAPDTGYYIFTRKDKQ